MPKLINLLNKNKMTLIVALPENNPELARAAVAGGADALQLHVNVEGFGNFKEERQNLRRVLSKSKIPTGIVPGLKKHASEKEMQEMKKMGFDFLNIDFETRPKFIDKVKGMAKVLSLNERFSFDSLIAVPEGRVDALDAAIIPASGLGKELIVGDLQHYISIILAAGIPVIIPTQREIRVSEVAIISDTGAKGILLTSVVTGTTVKHIEKNVREYRVAADDLGD